MPLEPGSTLGPYQVSAKIGEGGMGEVYQARDTKLDRDVAVKVLPEEAEIIREAVKASGLSMRDWMTAAAVLSDLWVQVITEEEQ